MSQEYASGLYRDAKNTFEQARNEQDSLRREYLDFASSMSPLELAQILNQLGTYASNNYGYKSQAYGMVYNDIYSIYNNKIKGYFLFM